MSLKPEERYAQISEDWRHRDNLTWQLPTVLIVITIAIFAVVLTIVDSQNSSCSFLLPVLYIVGFVASFGFTIMLGQNLWYQLGSTFLLKEIENNSNVTFHSSSDRLVTPKDSKASCSEICIALFRKLLGSSILFAFCSINTVVFVILFGLSFSLSDYDCFWYAIKSCLLII